MISSYWKSRGDVSKTSETKLTRAFIRMSMCAERHVLLCLFCRTQVIEVMRPVVVTASPFMKQSASTSGDQTDQPRLPAWPIYILSTVSSNATLYPSMLRSTCYSCLSAWSAMPFIRSLLQPGHEHQPFCVHTRQTLHFPSCCSGPTDRSYSHQCHLGVAHALR